MKSNNLSLTIIGCGWLGIPLGKTLVQQGHTVFGSVRNEERSSELESVGIEPFVLDLEKSTKIPKSILTSTSVLVITLPPIDRQNPTHYPKLLTELLAQFSDETQVIFTSSTGIYPEESGIYDEDFQFSNQQESSVLPLAESAIRSSEKAYTIFRLGGLIGPNRHPIRFLQGRKRVKNPDGAINFVHQGDCLRSIIHVIDNQKSNEVFNLVYPYRPSRISYYTNAAKHYGFEEPEFETGPKIDRIISSEKVKSLLNFQFEFPIDSFPEL